KPGSTVILFDDVTTKGGSVMQAVAAVRGRGARVKRIITLVDRLEGAQEKPGKEGPALIAPYSTRDLLGGGEIAQHDPPRPPGLDPRVHLLRKKLFAKRMDCQVKPGHDALTGYFHLRERTIVPRARCVPFPACGGLVIAGKVGHVPFACRVVHRRRA